jgi:carbon monoxide dehydrogenase subunit G
MQAADEHSECTLRCESRCRNVLAHLESKTEALVRKLLRRISTVRARRTTGQATRGNNMVSIRREIQVQQPRAVVWDAVRDVGAIHKRLVPGFVVDCRLEGDSRHLTFANGMQIRELIVAVDDEQCRHAWSARGGPFTHHNASLQVIAEGQATCRLVWIADLLPDDVAGQIAAMIEQALGTMKATLEGP